MSQGQRISGSPRTEGGDAPRPSQRRPRWTNPHASCKLVFGWNFERGAYGLMLVGALWRTLLLLFFSLVVAALFVASLFALGLF